MRYATVVLTWDGDLHPVDAPFARDDALSLEAIRTVSPVHEGRYAELLEFEGDAAAARAALDGSPDVLAYDVTGTDGRGVAYVRCRAAGLVEDLLAIRNEREIVLEWPVRYVEVGGGRGLELTVFGTSRAIRRAAADLPDGISFELERLGEYEPEAGRLSAILTDRQRELLEFAVREGYYEVPRATTHRELARELELATGTVSEGLQRIEAKLIDAYVDS